MNDENKCLYELFLFRCKAELWENEKDCKFYTKLAGRQRCLFKYDDGRCGNQDAHRHGYSEKIKMAAPERESE